MADNCLAGCVSDYYCGGLRRIIDAEVVGPWVRIRIFGNNNTEITVGNESGPKISGGIDRGHTACISNFQYGNTDGAGIRVEIVDEEGGSFEQFFNNIIKDMKDTNNNYKIEASWGWVGNRCYGETPAVLATTSRPHYFMITQLNIRFEQTMKFIFEGIDLLALTFDSSRNEKTFGSDEHPISLKEAINQLLTTNNPKIPVVKYLNKDTNPRTHDGSDMWTWKDNPMGVWHADQQNMLSVIKKWIRGYTTNNDKGVYLSWDDTSPQPAIVLWEDGMGKCDTIDKECLLFRNIGMFIVNGGECSNVISFKEEVHWNLAAVNHRGGFMDNKTSTRSFKQQDGTECDFNDFDEENQGAGLATNNVIPAHHHRTYGKDSPEKFRLHDSRHSRVATQISHPGMTAQLTIQGDPTLDDPILLNFASASIVYINPFHLHNSGQDGCPDWVSNQDAGTILASSSCNKIISNHNWIVEGVSHEIQLGAYTTTLKLRLPPTSV